MNNTLPGIPHSTGRELANPAPPGGRHAQIVKIACSLRSSGWQPEAIFHQIRPNYGADVSDGEIRRVIGWSENRLSPGTPRTLQRRGTHASPLPKLRAQEDYTASAIRFLRGFECGEADVWEASPCRLDDMWGKDALLLISHAYSPGESINVVTDYLSEGEKARPSGFGTTATREEWLEKLSQNSAPESEAGAWVRINPTDAGGIADTNVNAFRYLLLESDKLPENLQLPLLSRLPLPLFAIISSGGRSLHGWIKVDVESLENYRELARSIFSSLGPLGFDVSNKNPSRLSRLPGITRKIGASNDGRQRLLYLNPNATEWRTIL